MIFVLKHAVKIMKEYNLVSDLNRSDINRDGKIMLVLSNPQLGA